MELFTICSEKDIPHFSRLYGITPSSENRIFSATETISALANAGDILERETPRFEKMFSEGISPDIISAELENRFGLNISSIAWLEIPDEVRMGEPLHTFRYWAKELRDASDLAKPYCSALAAPNRKDVLATQVIFSECSFPEIRVSIYPIPTDDEPVFCEAYSADTISTAVTMLFLICLKDNVYLKVCKNCGKYFAPVSKISEIYCPSCRHVTYDSRIKDDPILREYRKIYKTQSARKARNSHIPNIEQRFQNWIESASTIRDSCIAGKITLDAMISQISSKDWMSKK